MNTRNRAHCLPRKTGDGVRHLSKEALAALKDLLTKPRALTEELVNELSSFVTHAANMKYKLARGHRQRASEVVHASERNTR
jgi:hypothetical protein